MKKNEDKALANYIRMIKDIPLSDIDAKKLFTNLKDKCSVVRDELKFMKEDQDDIISDTMNEWMLKKQDQFQELLELQSKLQRVQSQLSPDGKTNKIEKTKSEIQFMNELVQPLTSQLDHISANTENLIVEDKELLDPLKEISMPKEVEQSLIQLDQEVYDLTVLLEKNLKTQKTEQTKHLSQIQLLKKEISEQPEKQKFI